ncbi:hypothetical protein D8B23_13995 [Verminephrobacter aporrectodeae subsp. tuberculatae]|uniref:Ig-like domain-containing protein n=2 Tax=Verminephrobacter aporrectodeae TaxID=1110389 RepID=UPI0022447CB8|nr:Ig-like domain-containing protein [Verminephrobacter aporrectodeae]MCW8199503.1 hypothetical protein [Verminephrobacter aporrectodeae subsp. tuberculatae]
MAPQLAASDQAISHTALGPDQPTTSVTIKFSEAVKGFGTDDVTLATGGGSVSAVTAVSPGADGSSDTWQVTIAGGTGTAASNGITVNLAGVMDIAGNAGVDTVTVPGLSYSIDNTVPTASITLNDNRLAAGETAEVTIAFSERVTGFELEDLAAGNGTLSNLRANADARTWTATLTPTATGVEGTEFHVTLNAATANVRDLVGNALQTNVSSAAYTLDRMAPQLAASNQTISHTALGPDQLTTSVTIKFSEAVGGFGIDDVTLTGGSVSAVTAVSPGADGSSDTWQVTIAGGTGTAASNGITVNLAGVRDIAGNAGVDTVTVPGLSYSIDNTVPTATITLSDNRLAIGEMLGVTVQFSERVSGFDRSDLTVGNGTLSDFSSSDEGRTWTATLTPTATGVEGTEFHIMLNAATANVRDLVGNVLQTNVSSAAYTLDRMAAQLAASGHTISHTALGPDQQTTSVTIKFSEAVGGFGIDDVTLTGGSVSEVRAVNPGADGSSDTWQVTIAGGTGTSVDNSIKVNLAGVMDVAGNAGVGTATVPGLSYSVDNTVPTASITLSDNRLAAGETAEVTVAFSERVTGFELEDLAAGNGMLSNLRANAEGRTWTATLTPTATGVEGTEFNVTLNAATANVRDLVGNALQTNVSSAAYTLDRMAPQLAASDQTISHTALGPDQLTTSVTIKFSEAVKGFGTDDVTLATGGGSVSAVTAVSPGADGSSDTWQVTIAGGTGTAASNGITVNLAGVMDIAGNAGVDTATVPGLSYSIDNTVPTASITLSDNRLAAGETTEVTIAFSERVTGFELEDLAAGNGTLSNLRANADGRTWTATLTPTATGAEGAEFHITLNAANANVRDLVGNALQTNVSSAAYTLDRVAPQLAASDQTISHTALGPDQPTTSVRIKFSEVVKGFGTDDVTLATGGGSVSAVTAVSPGADGSSDTWQVTITGGTGTAASNGITVNLAGVMDIAGNAGVDTATVPGLSYSIDNTVPTATITLSDNRLAAGETAEVTITFSERVTGFELEDLAVGNGTLSNLRANADGRTWTATLTPTATGVEGTEFHVTLNAATANVRDLVGNALQTNVSSAAYTLDRMAPQLAASDPTISHTVLGPNQPTTSVTIKFNEAVKGFGTDDVTLVTGGGSVSAVTAVSPGADGSSDTWEITIAGGTGTAAGNGITVNLAGVMDVAGNAGVDTATVPGLSYSVDNTVPTATITLSDNRLAAGETAEVTIAFSERVTGFELEDLAVGNGTLSNLRANADARTWTATLTPTASVAEGTEFHITLNAANANVRDLAGNALQTSASSAAYTLDRTAPELLSITIDDTALKIGDQATVTICFSEAVDGFTKDHLTVPNGVLSALTRSPDGRIWTGTLTPAANTTVIGNTIRVRNLDNVKDEVNNAAIVVNDLASANYVVDTIAPVLRSAKVKGNQLVFTYTEETALDANHKAPTRAFTVLVNGVVNSVTEVSVNATAKTVTLMLTSAVEYGQTVTVSYAPHTSRMAGGDSATLDTAGNAAGGMVNQRVDSFPTGESTMPEPGPAPAPGPAPVVGAGLTPGPAPAPGPAPVVGAGLTPGPAPAPGTGSAPGTGLAPGLADTTGPTLNSITLANTSLTLDEATIVTFTFSEAVDDFDARDIDLSDANGTLGQLSSTDGGITWTAVFTPTANVNAASNVIRMEMTGVSDAAGNAGVGQASSDNYTIDTRSAHPLGGLDKSKDTDRDNIVDVVEDDAPGIAGSLNAVGDGNGDGIADSTQSAVTSTRFILSPTAESNPGNAPYTPVTLVACSKGGKIDPDSSVRITSLVQKDSPLNLSQEMQMPIGLTSFRVLLARGHSETFSLYVDPTLGINGYWRKDGHGVWVNLASDPYGGKMELEGDRLRLDFSIADGGEYDADGKADGVITAPGGVAKMPLSIVGQGSDVGQFESWF